MRYAPWRARLCLACLLGGFWGASPALAHKVNVFAYAEGSRVHVQAYFNDGKPVVDSTLDVFGPTGEKKLLSGRTDASGEFSFPLPARVDLRLVLSASMGHRGEFLLPASELPPTSDSPARQPAAPTQPLKKHRAATASPTPAAQPKARPTQAENMRLIDEAQLRAVVRTATAEALDERLAPLTRMVAGLGEDRVRFSDVVAGIGYIFGLAGVAAWLSGRRPEKTTKG
ncbi:MAG: hypothetical protein V2A77_11200 [Pseudomonadota bacterium]